jgi:radical SAM protein with 4Fe4S-binding SPASM domain
VSSPAPASPWNDSPVLIFWELTRACDLKCKHCRAEAIPDRQPGELSTGEIKEHLRRIGEETSCVVVFTGGDPFRRDDLPELVETCEEAGLKPALTPSTTPLLTRDRLVELEERGLKMLALSIDGPDRDSQDEFRGEEGTFDHTLRGLDAAESLEIPLQINTTVCAETLPLIKDIGDLVASRDVFRWALFFIVRTGYGNDLGAVGPEDTEQLFDYLHNWSRETGIKVKTTNAPHFNRWKIQNADGRRKPGIVDGDGIMFISHKGDIYPSGFSEAPETNCGNVESSSPLSVYRNHGLFQRIRNRELAGKCGRCEFKRACGGSRANAYFETGDPLGSDPRCVYEPDPEAVVNS